MHLFAGMSKLAVALTVLMTLVTSAHADDTDSPKSPDTALMLSLGGTGASVAMIALGAKTSDDGLMVAGLASSLVTPSLGQWYAGQPLTKGMAIRAASAVATVYGFSSIISCEDDERCSPNGILFFGGLAGYAIGALYDIATAPTAAEHYNATHGVRLTLAPTMLRAPSGTATMGLGIGGSF